MTTPADPSRRDPGAPTRAVTLLRRRPKLWLVPSVIAALVSLAYALLYMGGILDPEGNLHRLPIAVVNEDTGAPPPAQRENLGTAVAREIVSESPGEKIDWQRVDRARARDLLASGKAYGALVIPADFTSSAAELAAGRATARPTITVLTNPGAGSLGSSMASQINRTAATRASLSIGKRLESAPATAGAGAAARVLLADPVAVDTRVGHPIGKRSGLGLSAFYYTLLLGGFIVGSAIHSSVDTSLGYAVGEIGPWRTRRPTVPVDRTQTLLLKMVMTAGVTVLTTMLLMVTCVAVLRMDASHIPQLWLFSYCASLAVSLGTLAIDAAFGSVGQLVSMFVFIALALPSSGATVPLQATPGFYRFLGTFEPMRQLTDGVRAVLYFDARADAGLARAWVMIAIGLFGALAFGFAMTRYYDRKGLRRLTPQPQS